MGYDIIKLVFAGLAVIISIIVLAWRFSGFFSDKK
jgi:hypothetical protein